jgi:polysaccharide biosynthesis protein PslG
MEGITTSLALSGYADFCAAAVDRYRDINPIWEIYNEPNRDNFWEPKANPAEYMTLAKRAITAIRASNPDAIIVAPALGHKMTEPVLELAFLEACLQDGLLPLVDALSIHPYVDPEMAGETYAAVQALQDKYRGDAAALPVLSSEWGFATNTFVDDDLQADLLTRMFLINQLHRVPVSIAYVAVDQTQAYVPDAERSFGIVRADYTPKPAFTELQGMMARLQGLTFQERLPSDPADYLLVFGDGTKTIIAAWTAAEAHNISLNATSVRLTGRPIFTAI